MKNRVNLKYFVNDCLWKPFFGCISAQTTSNVISWTILVSFRPLKLFLPKIKGIKLKKFPKFASIINCFCDLCTELEICY